MPNGFMHVELNTDDTGKAKQFYKAVFSWKLSDVKGMPYTMIDVGKQGVGGGIQEKQMPEAPNAWLAYVQVDNLDKTMDKAVAAGASVLVRRMDIGTMGAIGIFMDPSGAALGVWEPGKPAKPAKAAAPKKAAKKKKPAAAKKKAAKKKKK